MRLFLEPTTYGVLLGESCKMYKEQISGSESLRSRFNILGSFYIICEVELSTKM